MLFAAVALAALGLAAWARLPKRLVATSPPAFATFSPELTVSTVAALGGRPEIGRGDAPGSGVVRVTDKLYTKSVDNRIRAGHDCLH